MDSLSLILRDADQNGQSIFTIWADKNNDKFPDIFSYHLLGADGAISNIDLDMNGVFDIRSTKDGEYIYFENSWQQVEPISDYHQISNEEIRAQIGDIEIAFENGKWTN